MKVFKIIDLSIQIVILLFTVLILWYNLSDGFLFFFLGMGSWQLLSELIHLRIIGFTHFLPVRKKYTHLLLIAFMAFLLIGISLLVFPQVSIFLLYFNSLYCFILAAIYLLITAIELNKIRENQLRAHLLDLG